MDELRAAGPYFADAEVREILTLIEKALRTGILTDGAHVRAFEQEFADYCGVRHAVALSSGTAALEVLMRALDVSGSEVVVPVNTFLATANAVAFAGGHPVFADIDPETLCVGSEDMRHAIGPRTVGVVVVHIAGLVCPATDKLLTFCEERGLFLVEDAAHAHGATLGDRRAGALGRGAAFSFFPTKPMTTGEGGMITTRDDRIAQYARSFRSHGVDPSSLLHVAPGHNYRMSEIAAILGRRQLSSLDENLTRRRRVAAVYDDAFRATSGLRPVPLPHGQTHSYYKYPLIVADAPSRRRLADALQRRGIPTGHIYDPPCHLHPYAQQAYGVGPGDFPKAEELLPRVLCLPVHAGLETHEAMRIAAAVLEECQTIGLT